MINPRIIELQDRLRDVIHSTCNVIGCKDCSLWNGMDGKGGCAATDLQDEILDIEMAQP